MTAISSLAFFSCNDTETNSEDDIEIFSRLSSNSSTIDFKNILTENDSLNYFTYSYLYMGGGIATGDINNDGLLDLYFTGNQVSNRLYLNKGNLQFEDITQKAGVAGDDRWFTGVTMADVNGDGFLDIYCSVSGLFGPKNNLFFINNGDGTFTEKAEQYGINDAGNSIQSTFFDYDKDGDLDLYVANYPPTPFTSPVFYYTFKMNNLEEGESDHLYRNDGGIFTDVTKEAGVEKFGLSIGIEVADLNNDSWPDLYVSNDFSSPDYMFINNKDNTFREVIKKSTANTAYYGMGLDIADYNNDGFLDIFQVDMDPAKNRRKKANMASMNPQLFWDVVNAGFHVQNMQNVMQVNTGVINEENDPYFVNVSRMTGTSSTDWSWGPLFADLDNDGLKDLFISNGTRREINNNDFFNSIKGRGKEEFLKLSQQIPSEKIDNFAYKNMGGYEFKKANDQWGIKYEGFSNGVVYADLDNDGDLEIVLNNIDDEAVVFENNSASVNNFLKLHFKGKDKNTHGLGVRAYIKTDDGVQMQELTLTRGFQSSVAPELHFGLGKNEIINELKIVWPDKKEQLINNIKANETLTISYADALDINTPMVEKSLLFSSIKDTVNFPTFRHKENIYNDFENEILLPHRTSTFGPALAVGDLNMDGKEDYFIGGAKSYKGGLYFQTENGFQPQENDFLEKDKDYEDLGATIFDADADGDYDLYVVSGGNEFSKDSEMLQDRLYLNDGKGNLIKNDTALPKMTTSGSRVYHADFDQDGKEDILVLGRLVPGNYPSPAKSYLLKNIGDNGNAKFIDVTESQISEFESLGMATSAELTDFNNDGWLDIIVVGEWMPIRVFQNMKTGFKEVTNDVGLNDDTTGWWWSIKGGDFDNDGDTDYIVGNLGLNYKYKAKEEETFDIYFNDFDKNNQGDIILSYYNEGKQFPVRGRECSSQQIPAIKIKYPDYESFSNATLEDVYTKNDLENSLHYQVKSFASVYLENKNGQFIVHQLPDQAQLSSINQIMVQDYTGDGNLDVLIVGNLYWSEVETPRNDAGTGLFMIGDGQGSFSTIPANKSGFFTLGDAKDMAAIEMAHKKIFIVAKNSGYNEYLQYNN
ncbi:hypothetical protein GGR42_002029 [Saonia flava]|uniref:ASPIC/UnbV domain-containing protein n=1 Tax=Saonia flava TaxID=523696 RepID=A0A846QWF8_9FLAO|nr:VCBS repeat-containing protein [Saonia flava]NJB71567.1 hypothetical protein [Saonia flava]